MSYNVELTDNFIREAKPLIKKYKSLRAELAKLGEELSVNPTMGVSLGLNVYKIRMQISTKNKGKSGGARIITYVKVLNETVYLVSIYSKGKKDSITESEILSIINQIQID